MSSGPKPASRPTWATTRRASRTYPGLLGSVSETGSETPSPSPLFTSAVSRSIRPLARPGPPRKPREEVSPEASLQLRGSSYPDVYDANPRPDGRPPKELERRIACLGALFPARYLGAAVLD